MTDLDAFNALPERRGPDPADAPASTSRAGWTRPRRAVRTPTATRSWPWPSTPRELDDDELEAALARHPRIGERAGAGHDAAFSAREQSGVDRSDADVAARLADGNRAYEERFDRVFLIRAAGRDAAEILAELERRLDNDDETERGGDHRAAARDRAARDWSRWCPDGNPEHARPRHEPGPAGRRRAGGARVRVGRGRSARASPTPTGGSPRSGRSGSPPGDYTLRFDTGAYFSQRGTTGFYPEVVVTFVVEGDDHFHVPLLLSPYGYSTYRGS